MRPMVRGEGREKRAKFDERAAAGSRFDEIVIRDNGMVSIDGTATL
jgi:hypothetical protein